MTSFKPVLFTNYSLLFLKFKPHSLPGSMMADCLDTGTKVWFLKKYISMYLFDPLTEAFMADYLPCYLKRQGISHETWINYFTSSPVACHFLAFCWHSSLILIYSGFLDVSRKNPGYEDTNLTISDNWQLIGVMLESWFAFSSFAISTFI